MMRNSSCLQKPWRRLLFQQLLSFLGALAVGAAQGSYCPITVSYEVSLGQAPLATATETGTTDDFTDIPIFFGKIGIFSNNVSPVINICSKSVLHHVQMHTYLADQAV